MEGSSFLQLTLILLLNLGSCIWVITQKIVFVPLSVQLLPSFFFFFNVGGFYLGRWWWWRANVPPSSRKTQLRNESWSTAQTVDLASKSPLVLIQSEVSQRNSGTNRRSQPTWPQESTTGALVSHTRGHADRSRVPCPVSWQCQSCFDGF